MGRYRPKPAPDAVRCSMINDYGLRCLQIFTHQGLCIFPEELPDYVPSQYGPLEPRRPRRVKT